MLTRVSRTERASFQQYISRGYMGSKCVEAGMKKERMLSAAVRVFLATARNESLMDVLYLRQLAKTLRRSRTKRSTSWYLPSASLVPMVPRSIGFLILDL